MEVYDSEREQIDAMKKFWLKYGKAISGGLILGVASLIGWQQWGAYVSSQRETASAEYDVMMSELQNGHSDAARQRALRIVSSYKDTAYADLAALALAKVYVESDDLTSARVHLQSVVDGAKQEELKHVARLRLARLMVAQEQHSQALTMVRSVELGSFKSLYDEVVGDANVALGNVEMARQAYQSAIASVTEGGDTVILQMKLDELGVVMEATL